MANESSDDIDLTSKTIGGYRVLHRLGRGGMSTVYLAFQENLRRHVAFKVLRQDLVDSPDHLQRFLQEARAAASLIHPNIVQVYDIGRVENIHFITQEYIPGSTLRNYVQRCGRLPINETLSILLQITAALQKASSIGIVHRDIKPENILLTPDGEVKVADFGLARSHNQDMSLTDVGVTLGTPLYMSPEQIQGKVLDSRSDLYSLGVTAFYMLAGYPPFQGETPLSLAVQHLQNSPPNLAEIRADLPEALVKLIHRLLSKSPDERYSSAASLMRDLREIADTLSFQWRAEQPIPFSNLVIDIQSGVTAQTIKLQNLTLAARKRARKERIKIALWLVSSILLFAATSLWFASHAKPSLIQMVSPEVPPVPRKGSVEEQYFHGLMHDDVPEWRAVEEFFHPDESPVNRVYNHKAWLRLARVYVRQKNLAEAKSTLAKIDRNGLGVDAAIHVLMLIELTRIELEEGNREQGEALRKEAQALYNTLPQTKKDLIDRTLPKEYDVFWNRS